MENPTQTNQNLQKANSNALSKQQNALALRENSEAQGRLDNLLLACFSVQKMYGRQPENIEVINQVFHNLLGKYPSGHVLKAFEIWMASNQEFPTPADIIGIIKRKGRPPLSKEMYISISRKDYENRTWQELNYMRDYEAEHQESEWGSDFTDTTKDERLSDENSALRTELANLKSEYARLSQVLHDERVKRGIEKPAPTMQSKIDATIEHMRKTGASEEDIEQFLKQAA